MATTPRITISLTPTDPRGTSQLVFEATHATRVGLIKEAN